MRESVRTKDYMIKPREWWINHQFNNWIVLDQQLPEEINGWSNGKILAKCQCGNEKYVLISSLFLNKSKSCGDCSQKPKAYWLTQKFNKLRLIDRNLTETLSSGTHKKVWFLCDCGKETNAIFKQVLSGNTTSCGKCNAKHRTWWLETTFGDLKIIDSNLPEFLDPTSIKKVKIICTCGNIRFMAAGAIYAGNSTTCGHCHDKPKEWWLSQTFGNLHVLDKDLPSTISGYSKTKLWVKCTCNREKKVQAVHLFSKAIISCTQCNSKSKEYWLSQKFGKLTLIDKDLPDFFVPYYREKVLFGCDCGIEKNIDFGSVYSGYSQSCGCQMIVPGGQSQVSKDLFNDIQKLVPDARFSVRDILKAREIDIYVPSQKLAIEYNGLPWHSERFNGLKRSLSDFEKYKALKELGIKYIGIFSDEWNGNKDIFLNLILSACGYSQPSKRIYDFDVKEVSQKAFQVVHDKFHYLSGRRVSATKYLLAYYKDIPVGGWSFKKNKEGVLDWNRAFWDHNYKAWNPHSKVLDWIKEHIPEVTSVISFSDNRLFDGSMYQTLGFKKVKELVPDYEYTNNFKRVHKFNFRVKAGIDERVEAEKQGFYRIYDCGKTKWELILNEQKNIR